MALERGGPPEGETGPLGDTRNERYVLSGNSGTFTCIDTSACIEVCAFLVVNMFTVKV